MKVKYKKCKVCNKSITNMRDIVKMSNDTYAHRKCKEFLERRNVIQLLLP